MNSSGDMGATLWVLARGTLCVRDSQEGSLGDHGIEAGGLSEWEVLGDAGLGDS